MVYLCMFIFYVVVIFLLRYGIGIAFKFLGKE